MKKKLILTSLLGLFGFVGAFASADSVGNFTSDSEICSVDFSSYFTSDEIMSSCSDLYANNESLYLCISSSDSPFYLYWDDQYNPTEFYVNSSNYCGSSSISRGENSFYFYKYSYGTDNNVDLNPSGTFYFSATPITYSAGGDNSGGSLLPGGESDLSGIITGLNSTINEFIPYLVYLGLGIITVIIGFVAIRWLVNRTQAKIRGTFSSGRRRR